MSREPVDQPRPSPPLSAPPPQSASPPASPPLPSPPPAARARTLAHVSIAVEDAEAVARTYGELLGATVRTRETLADRGLLVIFIEVAGIPIELVQPLDPSDESNPVVRFLRSRGTGLHHLAFFVEDAQAALDHARAQGARLVDESPRAGADGHRVAFLHPSSTAGVLMEFVDRKAREG